MKNLNDLGVIGPEKMGTNPSLRSGKKVRICTGKARRSPLGNIPTCVFVLYLCPSVYNQRSHAKFSHQL